MNKRRILTFLVALMSFSLAGCVKYNGVPQESPIKLTLSETELELKKGDGGKTFIPTLSSTEEEIDNNKLSIEIKDKKIVSTDVKEVESGKPVRVKALNYGETIITVTSLQDKDCKGEVKVTVVETPSVIRVEDLEVTYPNPFELLEGETANIGDTDEATIKYTVLPSNANVKDVTYSANPESVVKVSADGVVTAVAKGEGTIRITTVDGGISKDIPITVKQDETLVEGNFYLIGSETEWKAKRDFVMSKNPGNDSEYMLTYQGKADEEVIMIKYNGKDEQGVEKKYTYYKANVEGDTQLATTSASNCKLLTDKKVTFYISTTEVDDTYHYWVALAS